ncbi:MAG: triose-phosphate isomerase [Bacteroidetes bacterium]|nr:triose-phosphate isomerase [Bacteroidota bacterium]
MRKKIVAGNWKMNKTFDEGVQLVKEIIELYTLEVKNQVYVVLAPPFIHLYKLQPLIFGMPMLEMAGQNCSNMPNGAYTGEISASMLKSVGCDYVIIGHSERRLYFNETNDWLAKKIDIALANLMQPIYCVGETLEERNNGKLYQIIEAQLSEALFHLPEEQLRHVVIAYEPVWAIGTGLTATSAQAQEMHAFIRKIIADKYGNDLAENISILYGGSVKPDNARELFEQPDIDGGLIGGAALQARGFVDIVKAMK